MTTLVLVEDHAVVRQGLRSLLEAVPDFSIVGEAADGPDALACVKRLKPDVLVLDMMLPGLHGLEVARQVRRSSPGTRTIVLSMYATEAYVLEALEAGVAAYVLKKASAAELVNAIREALAGRRYLSPPLSEHAIEAYIARAKSAPDPYQTLTQRERDVLHLAIEGLNNTEIARRLVISPRTVEMHRTNLMRKLGLHSQTDLILFALKQGFLSGAE